MGNLYKYLNRLIVRIFGFIIAVLLRGSHIDNKEYSLGQEDKLVFVKDLTTHNTDKVNHEEVTD